MCFVFVHVPIPIHSLLCHLTIPTFIQPVFHPSKSSIYPPSPTHLSYSPFIHTLPPNCNSPTYPHPFSLTHIPLTHPPTCPHPPSLPLTHPSLIYPPIYSFTTHHSPLTHPSSHFPPTHPPTHSLPTHSLPTHSSPTHSPLIHHPSTSSRNQGIHHVD